MERQPPERPTEWSQDGTVLRVRFTRPDRLNSLTPDVLDDLERLLDRVRDDDVKAVVLTGAGRAFSVGMDIDFLVACFADKEGVFFPFCARMHALLRRIETSPALFVAAVDGLARAGGFELLLACDLVVATTRARVADDHAPFGVIPGGGAAARAVHRLGPQRARDLLLTGRWLEGPEIAEAGLACAVVEPDDLEGTVDELLRRVDRIPRPVLSRMKRLVDDCASLPLDQALEREWAQFTDYLLTEPTSDDNFRAWVSQRG